MPWGSVSDRVIGVAKDIYIGANLTFGGTEASDRACLKTPSDCDRGRNLQPSPLRGRNGHPSLVSNARVRIATNNGVLFGFSALALFWSPLCCLDRSLDVEWAALALGLFAAPVTGRPRMDQCIDGG